LPAGGWIETDVSEMAPDHVAFLSDALKESRQFSLNRIDCRPIANSPIAVFEPANRKARPKGNSDHQPDGLEME
jgi:hypothetical protein